MPSLSSFSTFIDVNTILYEFLLYAVLSVGDFLLAREYENLHFRIFTDSLTHGLVGFFSWAIVIDLRPPTSDQWVKGFVQCIICMGLAMLVDVDHVIAARSINLHDLTSLPSRPHFHATTIIIPIAVILWTLGDVYRDSFFGLLCPLFIVAWLSHHIRDAARRGLWLPPFGSTPVLSQSLYIVTLMALPLVVWFLLRISKSKIVQTDVTVAVDSTTP
ncbi:transmembrane protein 267-like [Mizuhopecten yessoensis]|uniref:Transmembrane protein 267 n=1 Tax=Mizuhopecten yessoensis TaxID=6573 RepID=A0A210QPF1_MIZYE|nr:transmembrane protein 267-like [Mizuhopecten yessoensis]XP_021353168.1 transmembrane protein 267-like [Mizuhopecten yessoensis]OWF50613.1 Transmembrane protein C5orf28-like [Mizuhopecten yessoensis]